MTVNTSIRYVPLHQGIILTADFTDANGTAGDPNTVTFTVEKPDGTSSDYTGGQLTHPSTGRYQYSINDCDQLGDWTAWVRGTGTLYAASYHLTWNVRTTEPS